jgi:hypothetical protein
MRTIQIRLKPAAGMASLALQSTAPSAATMTAVMTLATGDDVEGGKGYGEADNGDCKSLESARLEEGLMCVHASQYADNLTENQDGL